MINITLSGILIFESGTGMVDLDGDYIDDKNQFGMK